MEKFTVNHNCIRVNNMIDFASVNGRVANGCKNVCFVRIIGENPAIFSDIKAMDASLAERMANGKCAYKRISSLPMLVSGDDIKYYTDCYTDWVKSGRNKAAVRYGLNSEGLKFILGNACAESVKQLQIGRGQLNEAVEKNFVVKLLFWFDCIMEDLMSDWSVSKSVKIVGENTVKVQEYIFFYMLTLVGFDVLLIQNRCDLEPNAEKLNLSAKITVGNFGKTVLPTFDRTLYGRPSQIGSGSANNESIKITLPERPNSRRNTSATAQSSAQSGNIRITLPERPNARRNTSATAQSSAQSGNIRITLPERPNSRRNTTAPVQPSSQSGVRVAVPERPDSRRRIISTPPQPVPSFGRINTNSAERREKSYEELAALASSVVMISLHDSKGEIVGSGSGIMIGRKGYILTNCHVASAGKFYSVRLENENNACPTDELIKYNNDLDLAVIRIDRALNPIPIYRGQQKLVRGQRVVAIGSPLGLFNSVSDGIISGFRKVDGVDMIQFTAPISNGSSGGAVLNMYGEVIGISTAGIDSGQNINLAVGYESILPFVSGFVG